MKSSGEGETEDTSVRAGALVAAFCVSILLAVCSRSGGPLDTDEGPGALCAPVGVGEAVTFGMEVLENSSSVPVIIDAVQLIDPVGLSIVEARVIRLSRDEGGA